MIIKYSERLTHLSPVFSSIFLPMLRKLTSQVSMVMAASLIVLPSTFYVLPQGLLGEQNFTPFLRETSASFQSNYSSENDVVVPPLASLSPVLYHTPTTMPSPTPKPSQNFTPATTSTTSESREHSVKPYEDFEHHFYHYADKYKLNPQKLITIARCESNFNSGVVSANGLYGGLFQYLASTWVSTRNHMGKDPDPGLRFDPEQAIHTTAFKISVGGIGAWPHCSRVALNNL